MRKERLLSEILSVSFCLVEKRRRRDREYFARLLIVLWRETRRSRREGKRGRRKKKGFDQVAIFLRLIDPLKCTHPFLFALQQVESACSLDARKEPDRMGAYKPLDQGDVARDLAARIFRRARRSTRGGRPFRGKRLLALKTLIPLILLPFSSSGDLRLAIAILLRFHFPWKHDSWEGGIRLPGSPFMASAIIIKGDKGDD